MSHKSTPRSSRIKSPCPEGEERDSRCCSRGNVLEEMQRELEEELAHSERLLNAANNLMSQTSKGGMSRRSLTSRTPEGGSAPGTSAGTRFSSREEAVSIGSGCKPGCKKHGTPKSGSKSRSGSTRTQSPTSGPSTASSRRVSLAAGSSNASYRPLTAVAEPSSMYRSQCPLAEPSRSLSVGPRCAPSRDLCAGVGPSNAMRQRMGPPQPSPQRQEMRGHDHERFMKGMPETAAHGHHHHHDGGKDAVIRRDSKATEALAHLSQLKKTPSYYMCDVDKELDFMKACYPRRGGPGQRLPEMPCLQQEELDQLIKCEQRDVESARYLASDERKTYKKPCPKQQKAQMSVMALVKAHAKQTCGEKYSPLDHPEPEDISPELAASMMFSQEEGIRLDSWPRDTIMRLFPDEPKQPFPEKVPRSSISVVDPSQRDRDEMMEKSASVPSEGVSDSAYTRTMREKGEEMAAQKSYDVDFAIGQSKREYVLVAQKPQRINKMQFRGNSPSWFPGYFSAFPGEDGGLKSISSLSGLFHKAWLHTNPRNIPASDVIVID